MTEIHSNCFICQSPKLKKLSTYYEKHGLVKCKNCGFVFMERIPSVQTLNEHYGKYSYATEGYLSPQTVKSYNKLLDEFEKYRNTNKLLDVGCGRGWFLQEAKKRGWKVYGSEYSETAVELCKSKGIEMISGQLQADSFESNSFDVITSFEVIEHINNPLEDLEKIYAYLRSGGLFYCTTPNFNSLLRYYLKEEYNIIEYPEHLSYYTKKTLNNALKKSGFTPIKFLSTGISINRIKASKKTNTQAVPKAESSDEKLRELIDNKWYLELAKSLVNNLLTILGMGLTLKGYYVKK